MKYGGIWIVTNIGHSYGQIQLSIRCKLWWIRCFLSCSTPPKIGLCSFNNSLMTDDKTLSDHRIDYYTEYKEMDADDNANSMY